ncbi:hypothetical protein II906_03780 [bacterium]|nr:hypothetical protein [bacterium]
MDQIIVNHYQPTVYPKRNDGKQEISLYDPTLGGQRQIISSPDKIDEFVTQRNKASKRMLAMSLLGGAIGAVAGVFTLRSLGKSVAENSLKVIAGSLGAGVGLVAGEIIGAQKVNKTVKDFINENK